VRLRHTEDAVETFNPPRQAEIGDKLYYERFHQEYSPEYLGEILAIDVESEKAYLGHSVIEALDAAEKAHKDGFFHVVKIGSPGVYRLGLRRPSALAVASR